MRQNRTPTMKSIHFKHNFYTFTKPISYDSSQLSDVVKIKNTISPTSDLVCLFCVNLK